MTERVLYLMICAAGPARRIEVMVKLAQAQGWSVHCLATPAAVEYFLDLAALTELTGHPVRTTYRTPGAEPLPRAEAVIVAPATYNTINKWAAGIADNYVLKPARRADRAGRTHRRAAVRQPRAGRQPGVPSQYRGTTAGRRPYPVRARTV
jgi:3-polyprenyl-4-hydroxybenzoate decarboxylase